MLHLARLIRQLVVVRGVTSWNDFLVTSWSRRWLPGNFAGMPEVQWTASTPSSTNPSHIWTAPKEIKAPLGSAVKTMEHYWHIGIRGGCVCVYVWILCGLTGHVPAFKLGNFTVRIETCESPFDFWWLKTCQTVTPKQTLDFSSGPVSPRYSAATLAPTERNTAVILTREMGGLKECSDCSEKPAAVVLSRLDFWQTPNSQLNEWNGL